MHKGENVFSLNALKDFSLSPASREGPFHVMFVRTSMGSESLDDSYKITSALADSRIFSFIKMVTLYMCNFCNNHYPSV